MAPVDILNPVTDAVPITCSFSVGVLVPIPTFPVASTTNGVESGFVLSSTMNAFPVPVCVNLTRSAEVFPEIIIPDCVVLETACSLAIGVDCAIPSISAI